MNKAVLDNRLPAPSRNDFRSYNPYLPVEGAPPVAGADLERSSEDKRMKRTQNEERRKPSEILAAMDKDGVRSDSNLLTQLTAELNVSLAVQAEEVSRRNLKVASIACVVAVIALGISILQTFTAGGRDQTYQGDAAEYQRQVEAFNEQSRITNEQLARQESQLSRTEKQSERMDAQIVIAEKQSERYDSLLLKWEEQAKSQDSVLAAIGELLKAAAPKTNN